MHLNHAFHGLVLSATAVSAFFPYVPPTPVSAPKAGGVGKDHKEWKPINVPRHAAPFQPVPVKPVEVDKMTPVKELHIKRMPRPNDYLHPQVRAVQHANAITKRFRKRGIPGPEIDGKAAIQNVIASLKKRDLKKRLNNFDYLRSEDPGKHGSMAVDQDGSDFSYFSEINFGSKNKTFMLVLDTGSSDTWVPSTNCTSQACLNHATFGAGDSDTLEFENRKFSIRYGTGSVSGVVVRDYISFAGFTINIEFGLSNTLSSDFVSFPIDGIMGLGFPEISQQQAPTIMQILVKDNLVQKNMFSIALSRASDGYSDGVIHFGSIDPSYFEGKMAFTRTITDLGYWEIPLDDACIDGEPFGFTGRSAIIDTGTSLMLLPQQDAYNLHAEITGAMSNEESFAIPCDTNSTLGVIFNGNTYNIPAEDWVGEPTDQSGTYCLSHVIARTITDDTTWLLGDVFLKNVYTNFNYENRTIGFAKRAHPLIPTGTTGTTGTTMLPISTAISPASSPASPTITFYPDSATTDSSTMDGSHASEANGLTTQLCFALCGFFFGLVLVV